MPESNQLDLASLGGKLQRYTTDTQNTAASIVSPANGVTHCVCTIPNDAKIPGCGTSRERLSPLGESDGPKKKRQKRQNSAKLAAEFFFFWLARAFPGPLLPPVRISYARPIKNVFTNFTTYLPPVSISNKPTLDFSPSAVAYIVFSALSI